MQWLFECAFNENNLIKFVMLLIIHWILVSHTTDDMLFQWDPDVPLVVDENIELPQLQLVRNKTADCTQVYSTGKCFTYIFNIT